MKIIITSNSIDCLMKQHKDRIPGGLADDKSPEDFDKNSIIAGLKVELEHTDNPKIALEIAMDHLTEDPEYYKKLNEYGL